MPARWRRAAGVPAWWATTFRPPWDTKHHLIVAHEVTNRGTDRAQLSAMAKQTKAALETDELDVVADRGTYNGEEILACDEAGITVTLPKPLTSGAKTKGRFGKQDFVYLAADDVYRCPAGDRLIDRFTSQEKGPTLRRYWTNACRGNQGRAERIVCIFV